MRQITIIKHKPNKRVLCTSVTKMPERSHENSYYQIFGLLVQGQCVFGKGVGGFKIHGITCGMAQKRLSLGGIKRDNIGGAKLYSLSYFEEQILLLKSMAENMQTKEPSSHQPTSQSSDHPTPLSSHQPTLVESSTGTTEGPNNEPMQQPPSVEVDVHGVSSTKTGGGRLKSIVWNHFDKIKTIDGQDKAQCKYCKKLLEGASKNGTKHLHAHMEKCIQKRLHDKGKGQTFLIPKVTQGRQELTAGGYNEENARKDLACAIIMHEYPLSIVNHVGFRRFLATLQPQFQCPSRNTIKKEIFNVYDFEKSIVMKLLDTNEGRIAITSYMWTASNQKKWYMVVTAHYIDSSWTLQSHILRFIYVPSPHTSERLCNALVECLLDWNIDTKLSTITLDNCSTNDCMIEKIKNKLQLGTLIKEGAFFHMRCCAHILNLIVKDGLGVVKDGVEKIRDSVAYWIATPKRLEKFQETAIQLRIPCTKKLSLDCPTRWNSTYKMFDVAISYKNVFSRLKQHETQYSCFPSDSQWEFAKEVCKRLAIFNDITEMISGTKYPTANIYFPQICEIKMVLSEWVNSPNEVIQNMAEKMLQKFDSYWRIRNLCYDLVSEYQAKKHQDSTSSFESQDVVSDGKSKLCDYDRYIERKKRARTSTMKMELDHYLEEEYPTLQAIVRDVLAIPISTVASESTFSIGGQILTPHRNRLHYTTLEALMCSKSWLWNSENAGSRSIEESTFTDEIESDDEVLEDRVTIPLPLDYEPSVKTLIFLGLDAEALSSSPSRFTNFKKCAMKQNTNFKGFVCFNVETRWNSTYLMLDAALKHRKTFEEFEMEDMKYDDELQNGGSVPIFEDCEFVCTILSFLKLFYDATLCMSSLTYMTSNLYEFEAFGIGRKIKQMCTSKNVSVKMMVEAMKKKYDKSGPGRFESSWWKLNSGQFPIISNMARDLLEYMSLQYPLNLSFVLEEELLIHVVVPSHHKWLKHSFSCKIGSME
ncbi:putative AC transposase [Glycine soja]